MLARLKIAHWRRVLLAAGLLLSGGSSAFCAPSIELTNVPAFGASDELKGRVLNASPASCRVAVFIYVPSAGWWSKPYCDPQLTVIQPDGSWTADITTGGADAYATKITALLVSTNYAEPCVMGLATLPTNVTALALASVTVERADPSVRWISFSGYDWWVKDSPGLIGPGPNYFSNSTSNVWVDALGQLHLRITNRTNAWQCAEVVSRRSFGYGSYRFELNSVVNDINPSIVLGLFTWSDDPAYTHREIDVECGRWANPSDVNNAQFVLQPWDWPNHLVRYPVPPGLTNSTHCFVWESNRISYQSFAGGYPAFTPPTNLISSYTFANAADVPQSGDENVRLNWWLINGTPPTNNQEAEFVIKSFQFVPPAPAPPTTLTPHIHAGQFALDLNAQLDRRYAVQLSTNLSDWQNVTTLLATNTLATFTDTNSASTACRFYRVLVMP